MIGLGYHATITPPVIRRNVLEDPSWYTAYTPYQPEISQGRLEALLNFQTVVGDLTGLPTANASPARRGHRRRRGDDAGTPRATARRPARSSSTPTRCRRPSRWSAPAPRRWASRWSSPTSPTACPTASCAACWCSTPAPPGRILDPRAVIEAAHERGALAVVAADLLALTAARGARRARRRRRRRLLASASASRSSTAARTPATWPSPPGLERHLPGRLVGVSVDAEGRPAYRLALQTREQHIRRDKATSNICTAQVLLAVVASMYAVYHGPEGLRAIARAHPPLRRRARRGRCASGGVEVEHDAFFDTARWSGCPGRAADGRRRGPRARPPPAPGRRRPRRHLAPRSAPTPATLASGAARLRRRGRRPRRASTGHRRRAARRRCAATTPYLTHEVFSQPPQRDRRCCATCAGSRPATTRSTAA